MKEVFCMMTETLSPFVFWAQTTQTLSLKVDLRDIKNLSVSMEAEKLCFSACGKGSKGEHIYTFTLFFFSKVNTEKSHYRILDRHVEINLAKMEPGIWPRLIGSPQKPAWLKIDFDKWKVVDLDIDDEENRNIIKDYPGLYEKLQKEERGYKIEEFKKVYLVLYNLLQFVGFTYILIVIAVRYSKDGIKSLEGTYDNVGTVMKMCHLFMVLEVLHPVFRYTKNSFFPPLMQVSGRCIILFAMLEGEPRMQSKPVVFYLFIIWSLIELVRYPYYIVQVNRFKINLLTWLRYSLWVPLYPLGICCEGIIILRNIPYFEETLNFTIMLPNKWNFTFHFPWLMKIYLLLFFFPAVYFMMMHMYKERVKKLRFKSFKKCQ